MFIGVRRRVYLGLLVSLGCALGVVGFILVAGFIGLRTGGRWVHPVSLVVRPGVSSGSLGTLSVTSG